MSRKNRGQYHNQDAGQTNQQQPYQDSAVLSENNGLDEDLSADWDATKEPVVDVPGGPVGHASFDAVEETVATPESTEAPTQAPTPEPTEAPTEAPTPEPTAAPVAVAEIPEEKLPNLATLDLSKADDSALAPKVAEAPTETEGEAAVHSFMKDYLVALAPNTPVEPRTLARKQEGILALFILVLNRKQDFVPTMTLLVKYFRENRDGALSRTMVLRGSELIGGSKDRRVLFGRMMTFMAGFAAYYERENYGAMRKVASASSVVDNKLLSDEAKNRFDRFFR